MNASAINIIGNTTFDKKTINYLSVLKPAATAILLAPTKTDLKNIIQYTVLDLTLKKALSIRHENILLHPSDPYERVRTIVETAIHFKTYRKNIYETYFLGIIDEQSYFQLNSYLKRIYQDLPLDNKVKKSILKEHKILNLFSFTFTFDSFSIFRLNKNGEKVRNEIQRYFVAIEENLPHMIENSPVQALHLLSFLKGNIFLLKNLDIELLEKINTLILQNKETVNNDYFKMFDVFNFSEIFSTPISEEIKSLLNQIESDFNNRDSNDYDVTDLFD